MNLTDSNHNQDDKITPMNIDHTYEYWTKILGISPEELKIAIEAVGTSPSAIRKYFIDHPRKK